MDAEGVQARNGAVTRYDPRYPGGSALLLAWDEAAIFDGLLTAYLCQVDRRQYFIHYVHSKLEHLDSIQYVDAIRAVKMFSELRIKLFSVDDAFPLFARQLLQDFHRHL